MNFLVFSLSAKPIMELLGNLGPLATHKVGDILHDEEMIASAVKVAAVVSEVRVIVTKKSGQQMAFVKVRDDTGTLELVVFPKTFQIVRDHLIDNKPLLIMGKVDQRDDSKSVLVDEIITEANIPDQSDEQLFIRVPFGTKTDQLSALRDILMANPGNQKVSLVFEGMKGQRMDLPMTVSWSGIMAHQISELFELKDGMDLN